MTHSQNMRATPMLGTNITILELFLVIDFKISASVYGPMKFKIPLPTRGRLVFPISLPF